MHIQRQLREDGICLLTLDRGDDPVNAFGPAALEELDAHLLAIAEAGLGAKALIIQSAQPECFVAATNPALVLGYNREELSASVDLGQRTLARLAALPIPTLAALHGECQSGGLELGLACDWRVAAAGHGTRLGLPETRLGMLPAWGGMTRLPRLLGLLPAIDFIVEGRTVGPEQALELGLIDAIAPPPHLLAIALEWVAKGKRPAKGTHTWLSEMVSSPLALSKARGQLQTRTRGHYPAESKALEVIAGALRLGTTDEAKTLEREGALGVAEAPATRHLLELAVQRERARVLEWPGVLSTPAIKQVAILGAGAAGASLAQLLARNGQRVLLGEADGIRLAAGMSKITEGLQADAAKQSLTPLEVRDAQDRIAPTQAEVPLQRMDLVLETASENQELKQAAFARLAEITQASAILASYTEVLPITELARATRGPERVIGFHFPQPLAAQSLVEVIVTPETAPAVGQRALRFVQELGLLPVLVKDSPGFLVNRVLLPYLSEASELFWAGHGAREIDEALLDFGMAQGPLRAIDEAGVSATETSAQTLSAAFPQWMRVPRILPKMRESGLLGRSVGKGFYTHSGDKEPRANRAAEELRPKSKVPPGAEELQRRLVLLLVNEAARCLEEGLAEDAATIDFALVQGGGFAAFRGGPLHYADDVGLTVVLDELKTLASTAGSHYAPCALLTTKAAAGTLFFGGESLGI